MRRVGLLLAAQMMILLCACGVPAEEEEDVLARYREMSGCAMTAQVAFSLEGQARSYTLSCDYDPGGTTTVEVLEPEGLRGLKAEMEGQALRLRFEDLVLEAGTISGEDISPAQALPLLMRALREGWLLEQSREDWGETPCRRVSCDLSGETDKIIATLWLREEDGAPLHGELAVGEEIIFRAEFTDFTFGATMEQVPPADGSGGKTMRKNDRYGRADIEKNLG